MAFPIFDPDDEEQSIFMKRLFFCRAYPERCIIIVEDDVIRGEDSPGGRQLVGEDDQEFIKQLLFCHENPEKCSIIVKGDTGTNKGFPFGPKFDGEDNGN